MSIFAELGVREGKDRAGEELLYNLALCYSLALKRVEEVLAPYALSSVKMNALLLVKHLEGGKGLRQSDISRRMIVSAGNITRLVDRMAKEKLVTREAMEGDRRVRIIRITPKGSDLLDKVWPIYRQAVDGMAAAVPAAQIVPTTRALNELRVCLQANQKEGSS